MDLKVIHLFVTIVKFGKKIRKSCKALAQGWARELENLIAFVLLKTKKVRVVIRNSN